MTAPILNDRDLALQAAKYRSKQTNLAITGTASAFLASKNSVTILPQTIVLTATPSGSVFSSNAVYTWSYALSSAPNTFINLGTGKTWTINNTDSWITNASVQYRCIISENLLDSAYGYYTVTYSSEGAESNFITLSRTNVVVPCSSTGIPISFDNTDITIAVSRGTTDLVYSTNSTTPNSFTVSVADDGNLTRNLVATYTSTSTSFTMSGISALALDGATITFTINVYDSSTTPVATTYTKKVVYNKVSNGVVGASARAVDLTIGTQAFAYLSDGSTPSPANTVITATPQNTTGTVYYEFLVAGVSKQNTATNTYTYTPLAAYASMPEQITVKIRESSNSSAVLATDIASIIGIKPGVDSIAGNLSNPAATLIADSSGTIATGTVASGTFQVYDGIVDKTGDGAVTYSVYSFTTGLTISIASTGVYSVTGLSVDSGAAILRAVYKGVTIDLSFTIAKSKTGVVGASARAVNLTIGTQTFVYLAVGNTPSPANTVLTATAQNTTGTPYYEFLVAGVSKQNTTTNTYTYTPLAAYASMPEQVMVKLREGAANNTVVDTDTASIIGVKPAVNPITGLLTNESTTVIANSTGTVSSFANTGGTFYVYDGTVDKTGNGAVVYSVLSSTGLTISIASTGIYTISAMSADTGTATLRAVYGDVTLDKIYSITKNKAGVDARAVDLTIGTQAFAYLSDGSTPSPANTVITATPQNTTGTVYYEFLVAGVSKQNTATNTYTYTPLAAYASMPEQITVKIREGNNGTGSSPAPVLATDIMSIVATKPGVDSITGNLSNPTSTVLGDVYGNVASFANTSGTFYVYDGITNKTGNASVTYSVLSATGLTISIASTGVYTISAMGTDVIISTAILRAVYKGVTIDLQYTMDKSKPAADGSNINPIANYDFAGATLPSNVTFPGTVATYETGTATLITNTVVNQKLRLTNLDLVPGNSYIVSMRVKWVSGAWEGSLFYVNPSHGESGLYYKGIPQPALDVWTTINVDMRELTTGGTEYLTGGNITQLRFDFINDVGASVAIDYISVGKYGVAEATKSITLSMYYWATSAPAFSGAFTYTWSTGAISAYPAGWSSAAGSPPGNGYSLYQRNVILSDVSTATTTASNWNLSTVNTIGFRSDGTIGVQGDSARIAFIVTTSGTPPAQPGVTTGSTSVPSGWSTTATAVLTDGQYMYQSDGIYSANTGNITWGIPYLSNLKVGNLSALSASLGTVEVGTGGALWSGKSTFANNTTAGFFLGNDGGNSKFRIGNANNSSSLAFDSSTGVLTLQGGSVFNSAGTALLSGTTVPADINNSNAIATAAIDATAKANAAQAAAVTVANTAQAAAVAAQKAADTAAAAANVLNYDPTCSDPAIWPAAHIATITGGLSGTTAIVGSAGEHLFESKQFIVDRTRRYRVTAYIRKTAGATSGTVYLGLLNYDINGAAQYGYGGYVNGAWSVASSLTTSFQTFTSDFAPNSLNVGTVKAAAHIILGYPSTGGGRVEFQNVRVTDITEAYAAQIAADNAATAAATAATAAATADGKAVTAATAAATADGKAVTAATAAATADGKAVAAATAAATADGKAVAAATAAATKLAKAGADILTGPISFNTASAILVGTINDGLYLGNTGLVGKKAGVTTFAIDQAGNATFSGSLSAATGTFSGSLSAATGTFSGDITAASGSFSGTLSASNIITTDNIQDNAVTNATYATDAVQIDWGYSAGNTVYGITLSYTSIGKTVLLIFSGIIDSQRGITNIKVIRTNPDQSLTTIYDSNVTVGSFYLNSSGETEYLPGAWSQSIIDIPSAGVVTYTLALKAGYGVVGTSIQNSTNRTLALIELKK